jgi:hypothetical protein
MLRTQPILSLFLVLTLSAQVVGQEPTVQLKGETRTAESVQIIVTDLQRALDALDQAPVTDPVAREADRAALRRAVDSSRTLIDILDRIRKASAQKTELDRQLAADREKLTEALVVAQRPARFDTMPEATLKHLESQAQAANQALAPANAALTSAEARFAARKTQF